MITPQQVATRNICTTYGCDTPTGENTYLCREHIIELHTLLEDVPGLRICLDPTVQAGKNVRVDKNADSRSPRTAGSRPPINLEAVILQEKLAALPARASHVAFNDPQAGQVLRKAKLWIESARHHVYGATVTKATDPELIRDRLRGHGADLMTARAIVPWFRDKGITITRKQLNNWVQNGRITAHRDDPDNKDEHPKYEPVEVYFAYNQYRRAHND